MHAMMQLWLPVIVTAVSVFVASSLVHMVFKWHNSDYRKLPNEDEVRAAIRAGNPGPGQYVVPHCMDMKAMQSEQMLKKYVEGPLGFITLRKNGVPGMGGALLGWFAFVLALAVVCACITAQIYGFGGNGHREGHLVGLISLLAYGAGSFQQGIWMGRPWSAVFKDLLDAFIYAAISAVVFWQLWP